MMRAFCPPRESGRGECFSCFGYCFVGGQSLRYSGGG